MIIRGDCIEEMAKLAADSVDAVVTDPPAGISFMGKAWDGDKGGREQWVAWFTEVSREMLRVMKPGAHGLVWALPRTSHWTATALEVAGFEVRDRVLHLFGTGFPKSLDVSKAIDKAAGAERAELPDPQAARRNSVARQFWSSSDPKGSPVTAPSTEAAKRWSGFGTALKPACEDWWLIRKPLSEKTVAANVLRWGTGALNIDASRIGTASVPRKAHVGDKYANFREGIQGEYLGVVGYSTGRFPSHLVLSHSPECVEVGTKKVSSNGRPNVAGRERVDEGEHLYGRGIGKFKKAHNPGLADADGTETVPAWECAEGCAVAELDGQSGTLKSGGGNRKSNLGAQYDGFTGDDRDRSFSASAGGASRFFYCSKASRTDRGTDNTHPTVKSTALMRYLIRLVTPPGGLVLDPFAGSGSTGVAATREGFQFIGIERDEAYAAIAEKRISS